MRKSKDATTKKKAQEREGGWGRPSIARFKNQGPAYRSFLGRVLRPGTATSWHLFQERSIFEISEGLKWIMFPTSPLHG